VQVTNQEEIKMLHPTILIAVSGIIGVVGLAIIDWYVWGTPVASNFHRRSGVQPLTIRELSARFLGGIVASNTEVLMVPPTAIEKVPCAQLKVVTREHNHGFKKVA
jgi:hypothetical protein